MIIKRDVEKRESKLVPNKPEAFHGQGRKNNPNQIWQAKCPVKKASDNLSIRNFQMGILGKCKEVIFALQETEALP